MAKVMIFGHSFVKYLHDYVETTHGSDHNFGFSEGERVKFYGLSGMDITVARRHLFAIKLHRPDIVVLELGTNDLCSAVDTVDTIGNEMHSIACTIRDEFRVQHVVVSQILRRECAPNYRNKGKMTLETFNARVSELNDFLYHAFREENHITFWAHKGMWCSELPLLNTDGVHLNENGNKKLYRSLRGAIVHATKQ